MYKTIFLKAQKPLADRLKSFAALALMLVGGISWGQTVGTVQIGSGTETSTGSSAIPVTNYVYNYNQQIVSASDIAIGGGAEGTISKVRYQATNVGTMDVWNQWTVYIGNTTKTEFSSDTDWVDLDDLTQVFTGTITATANEWFEIEFDEPFEYTGGNLVIAIHEETPGWTSAPTFLAYTSTENSGIVYRNDGTNPDPENPPTATSRVSKIAQLQFEMALADCLPPADINAENVLADSAEISWTAPDGGSGFDYYYSTENTSPTDTTTPSGNTEDTTLTLEDLDPTTTYYFWVRSICDDSESAWVSTYFTTGCSTIDIPFWEGFNSDSTTEQCWTVLNENNDTDEWDLNYTTTPYEGNQSAMMYTDFNSGDNDDWLISPQIDLTNTLEAARLKFHYKVQSDTEPNDFRVMLSTTGSNPEDFTTELLPLFEVSNTDYQEMIINLVDDDGEPLQGEVYVAFHVPEDGLDGWRLYIDNVIIEPYNANCPDPTGLTINQVTENTIEIGWTAPDDQDLWHLYVVPSGEDAPNENTTDYIEVTENPYTIEGLDPATEYDIYIRSDCGNDDGLSYWTGPASTTTTQIPAEVDFDDDFEDEGGWTFTNGDQTNQWHIGAATAYEGDTSLYISDDDGETNNYSDTTTYAHAIRDLAFPANTNDVTISFYWKGVGQGSGSYFYDYMTVWLMPSTYQPAEGVQITADDGGIQLGAEFNNQEEWIQYFELLELSDFAGQTGRLIFEWTNNTYTNNPPPAAVDNVEVLLVTCSRPIEVAVEKNQITGDLLATWTPVAGETQWEVIVQDASEPAPDDTATGVIVDEPQYLIEDVVEGEFYRIYVRAICSEDDKSLWTEGVDFSDFNPPACANIDMTFPDLNIDEMGDFIYCSADGELTLPLVADFDDSMFKSTTSYEVEQIEYAPPFPFLGGNVVPIEYDDDYTPSFDLPFNFCFFGNEYSYCRIGDNGVVTFGLPYTTDVEYCPWQLEGLQIPDPDFNIKNSIYGVFQDMLVTNNPGPDSQINYQVLGTYPCRALVVNFNEVPAFGDEDEEFRTTSQIVLYEITNIIEVYVKKRTADTSWPSEFSGLPGEGLLGIQNEDGTLAYTPPGRNTGAWDAEEEAWRFSPNGETSVEFGWYVNGEFYSDNPNDQITITEDTCVEARVTYPGCGGDDLVLSKEYCVKVAPEIVLDKPEDIKVCPVDGEFAPIDLTQKIPEAVETLAQNDNFDLNDYDVTFHQSEDAATEGLEAISDPENYVPNPDETIWIRVEHKSTGCFGLTSFEIFEGVGLALNRPDDVILCVYYDIIPETDLSQVNEQLLANISGDEELIVNYYNSQEDAIYGTNPIEDWANFEAPYLPYEVWVKVGGSAEVCESVISFQLVEGEGLPEYEHVDFDICTAYVLPELPVDYFYTTEYLAEGETLNPGTIIEGLGSHTIYVNVISEEGCITSSSYNVNIIECSIPRGISPNGDGLNDSFDLTDYFLLDLKIYNRDGREVYSHGMGYTNEWEGQSSNGNLLPDGTYYYRVITPVEELTGWVQLVREIK